jgi:PmbA protein
MGAGGELHGLAERAVELALDAGAGSAEAYLEDSVGREIRVFDGEVESLTEAGQRGCGIRTWFDGRVGYAYGTDLGDDGLRTLAGGAVEAARLADSDQHAAPAEADGAVPEIAGIFDPELGRWETPQKVELAKGIEAAARAFDPRVVGVETTVYADEEAHAAIVSSTGLAGEYRATTAYAYLQAIAADSDGDRQTGLGFGLARSPGPLDAEAIGTEAAERAVSLLGASKPASRSCPVVLDPTVAASFVGFVGGVLCADAVQRGRSPFAGRLGDAVAAQVLHITDDGIDPEGLASAPLDGEGAPRGRTPLIAMGRLESYLHDSYTARREGGGARTTANAQRAGYRSPPSVGTSNLIVAEGEASFEELVALAGDGMYVTDVAGLHSGVNPVSGTFSVGATGRLIAGGALADPADEFTIASDLEAMLKGVAAVGGDARWVPFGGSVRTPALLIAEMSVGGS